jgi:phosphate acyltransferase
VTRVALDAMGGDHGAPPLVAGALLASQKDVEVTLVGDASQLRVLVAGRAPASLDIVHASQVIAMDEEPAFAVRAKPDASVATMIRLLREEAVDAGVSAGSTGATLTAALLGLGRIPGVRRPAIAGVLPVRGHSGSEVILVDAGGSPDIQPRALVDWARLGSAYARARGVERPVVGLLNVGTEIAKGNELARTGYLLLEQWVTGGEQSAAEFVGNIEPGHVLAGAVDVVVTDGFTGNILVKSLEAAYTGRVGPPPGALVIGVRGTVVVAHGAAGPEEVAAALVTAADVADRGFQHTGGQP